MIKFYLAKLIPKKLGNKLAMTYENWLITPQNESLIEIKRKEFKERTRYLDPKILYTLTDEEKKDLRSQGYYVDLNDKTIKEIQNFKLTYNRHMGKYNQFKFNNFAIYQTPYYYRDQNASVFLGDPQFQNKIWRNRTPFKRYSFYIIMGYILLYGFYKYRLKAHIKKRNMFKKMAEINPNVVKMTNEIP
jgi:hypothetical protein